MSEPKRTRLAQISRDGSDRPDQKASGTRPASLGARAIDSVLLDYLNKPTAPQMPAVRLDQLQNPAGGLVPSGLPTKPPDGTRVPALAPLPAPAVEYEDDRPTGRFEAPAANPLEHVRNRAVLVRQDGDESGQVISLRREGILVGRSSRAEVHVADPSVSREHAKIAYEYGSFFVEDQGSQNGTLVGGRRVTRAELHDGDVVQFGHRVTFRFGLMDEAQEQLMRRLYDSSMRDPLTGADNRRNLDARLHSEIAFSQRHKRPLSVILLDIDFFKHINDRYGHPAGDEVLRMVAQIVRATLRTEDVLARYGGEEFAIVLRDTSLLECGLVADRVRERVAKTSIVLGGVSVGVTVSAGCSSLECCVGATVDEIIGVADRRLYRAKRSGRNRVVVREEP